MATEISSDQNCLQVYNDHSHFYTFTDCNTYSVFRLIVTIKCLIPMNTDIQSLVLVQPSRFLNIPNQTHNVIRQSSQVNYIYIRKKHNFAILQLLCCKIATCRRDVHCGDTTANVTTPRQQQPSSVVINWWSASATAATASLFSRWTPRTISGSISRTFGTAFPFILLVRLGVWSWGLGRFAVVFFAISSIVGFRFLITAVVTVTTAGPASVATAWATLVVALAPAAWTTLLAVPATMMRATALSVLWATPAAVSVLGATPISRRPATSARPAPGTWSTAMQQTRKPVNN